MVNFLTMEKKTEIFKEELACEGHLGANFDNLCIFLEARGISLSDEKCRVLLWQRILQDKQIYFIHKDNIKVNETSTNLQNYNKIILYENRNDYVVILKESCRWKYWNLELYPEITGVSERLSLLEFIYKRRNHGCWQYELSRDLNIDPKKVFLHLKTLFKYDLIVRLNVSLPKETPKVTGVTSSSLLWAKQLFNVNNLPEETLRLIYRDDVDSHATNILDLLKRSTNNIRSEKELRLRCLHIDPCKQSSFTEEGSLFGISDFQLLRRKELTKIYTRVKTYLITKGLVDQVYLCNNEANKTTACLRLKINNETNCEEKSTKNSNDEDFNEEFNNGTISIIHKNDFYSSKKRKIENDNIGSLSIRGMSHLELIYNLIRVAGIDGLYSPEISTLVSLDNKKIGKLLIELENKYHLIEKKPQRLSKSFAYLYLDKNLSDLKSCTPSEIRNDNKNDSYNDLTPTKQIKPKNQKRRLSFSEMTFSSQINNNENENNYMTSIKKLSHACNTEQYRKRLLFVKLWLEQKQYSTIPDLSRRIAIEENTKNGPDRRTIQRLADQLIIDYPVFQKVVIRNNNNSEVLSFFYDSRVLSKEEAEKKIRLEIADKRVESSKKIIQNVNNIEPVIIHDTGDNMTEDLKTNFMQSIYSQKILADYGYIFPLMSRLKILHFYLINLSFNKDLSLENIGNNMPIHLFLKIIGCGHINTFLEDNYINERSNRFLLFKLLPCKTQMFLHGVPCNNSTLNNISIWAQNTKTTQKLVKHLQFLCKLKLLNLDIEEEPSPQSLTTFRWILKSSICMNDVLINNINENMFLKKYKMPMDFEKFWNNFEWVIFRDSSKDHRCVLHWGHFEKDENNNEILTEKDDENNNLYEHDELNNLNTNLICCLKEAQSKKHWKDSICNDPDFHEEVKLLVEKIISNEIIDEQSTIINDNNNNLTLCLEELDPILFSLVHEKSQELCVSPEYLWKFVTKYFRTTQGDFSNNMTMPTVHKCHLCDLLFNSRRAIVLHYRNKHDTVFPGEELTLTSLHSHSTYLAAGLDKNWWPTDSILLEGNNKKLIDEYISTLRRNDEMYWLKFAAIAERLCESQRISTHKKSSFSSSQEIDKAAKQFWDNFISLANVQPRPEFLKYILESLLKKQINRRLLSHFRKQGNKSNFSVIQSNNDLSIGIDNHTFTRNILKVILFTPLANYRTSWASALSKLLPDEEIQCFWDQWVSKGWISKSKPPISNNCMTDIRENGCQIISDLEKKYRRKFHLSRSTRTALFGRHRDLEFLAAKLDVYSKEYSFSSYAEEKKIELTGDNNNYSSPSDPVLSVILECVASGVLELIPKFRKTGKQTRPLDESRGDKNDEVSNFKEHPNRHLDGGVEKHLYELTAEYSGEVIDCNIKQIQYNTKNYIKSENSIYNSFIHHMRDAFGVENDLSIIYKNKELLKNDFTISELTNVQSIEPLDPWLFPHIRLKETLIGDNLELFFLPIYKDDDQTETKFLHDLFSTNTRSAVSLKISENLNYINVSQHEEKSILRTNDLSNENNIEYASLITILNDIMARKVKFSNNLLSTVEIKINIEILFETICEIFVFIFNTKHEGIFERELERKFNINEQNENIHNQIYKTVIHVLQITRLVLRVPCGSDWKFIASYYRHILSLIPVRKIRTYKAFAETSTLVSQLDTLETKIYVPKQAEDIWGDSYKNSETFDKIQSSILQLINNYSKRENQKINFPTELCADIENKDRLFLPSNLTPVCTWLRLDGCLNKTMLCVIILQLWANIKNRPGQPLNEILQTLPLIDECEIKFILSCMVEEKILFLKDIFPSSQTKGYFANSASSVLPKFSDFLLTK